MTEPEPAANPQAQDLIKRIESAAEVVLYDDNIRSEYLSQEDRAAILSALSRPAADRGQVEACPFCGGDELNLADNEYRSRAIARLNNIARGQIVEECARVALAHIKAGGQQDVRILCEAVATAIRTLSPAPAHTEPQSSAEYHQHRGVAWDIVDEALIAYRGFMLDDDYDYGSTLTKIMKRMEERRALYHPAPAQTEE